MSRTSLVFSVLVTLLVLGVGVWRTAEAISKRIAASEEVHAGPAVVEVARVERRTLRDEVTASGTLHPVNEVDITADVAGRVVAVEADIGDTVTKGQVLVRLDDAELAAGLKQARATLAGAKAAVEAAELELDSSEELYAVQGLSDVQISAVRTRAATARAGVEQAEAGVALAKERHADATVRSPIAGVVTDRSVNLGQFASPGVPLFHVQDTSALEIEAQLDDRVATRVAPGMPVDVTVRGAGSVQGSIRAVSPSLDPKTRKAKVVVSVPDAPFLPYSTAELRLILDEREALSVPASALVHDGDTTLVVAVRGPAAARVPIHTGIVGDAFVEVDTLSEGELVVTSGAAGLVDGALVAPRAASEAL